MNVKEYISSGVIESYVLGLLSEQERQEFESIAQQYPEVASARTAFELNLEEQLLADATPAPAFLKKEIFTRINSGTETIAPVHQMEDSTPVYRVGAWRWVAAALFILLAGASFWAFDRNSKLNELEAENKNLEQQVQETSSSLAKMKEDAAMMQKPGMHMAALKGTQHAPDAYATIYWDTTSQSKDVYLMINNLPQPASGQQYQLWALMNGQPIDLGVFDMDVRQERLLVRMQNVQQAQAFAITLEPKGGSPNPTMDSMYVMGQL